jgi:hypothetical protein
MEVAHPVAWHRTFGLARKVVRVSSTLIVSWTGHKVCARILLNDLLSNFGERHVDLETLSSHLASVGDQGNLNCTLLGWVAEGDELTAFRWSTNAIDHIDTGNHFVEGSGAPEFMQMLSESEVTSPRSDPTPQGALRQALIWAGILIGYEIASAATIQQAYGAGYELYYFDGKEFQPADDVTYVVWDIQSDPGRRFAPRIVKFLKCFYANNFMLAQTAEVVATRQAAPELRTPSGIPAIGAVVLGEKNLFGIWQTAAGQSPPDNVWEPRTYSSNLLANILIVRSPNNRYVCASLVSPGGNDDPFLRFHPQTHEATEGISLSNEFVRLMNYQACSMAMRMLGIYDCLFDQRLLPAELEEIRKQRPRLSAELAEIARYLDWRVATKGEEGLKGEAARFRSAALRLEQAS